LLLTDLSGNSDTRRLIAELEMVQVSLPNLG